MTATAWLSKEAATKELAREPAFVEAERGRKCTICGQLIEPKYGSKLSKTNFATMAHARKHAREGTLYFRWEAIEGAFRMPTSEAIEAEMARRVEASNAVGPAEALRQQIKPLVERARPLKDQRDAIELRVRRLMREEGSVVLADAHTIGKLTQQIEVLSTEVEALIHAAPLAVQKQITMGDLR